MKLSIEAIAASGGFVSRKPVEETIKWTHDGKEFEGTVFVLPLSYATAKIDMVANQLQTDPLAARIAHCIVDEEGNPIFTVEDITGEADEQRGPLSSAITHALLTAIGKVSKLGKRPASLPTKTKSGTSSSSTASAVAPSKKRKSASATPSSSIG